MNIPEIISAFRDIIYPILGIVAAMAIVSFIPGVVESDSSDDESCIQAFVHEEDK